MRFNFIHLSSDARIEYFHEMRHHWVSSVQYVANVPFSLLDGFWTVERELRFLLVFLPLWFSFSFSFRRLLVEKFKSRHESIRREMIIVSHAVYFWDRLNDNSLEPHKSSVKKQNIKKIPQSGTLEQPYHTSVRRRCILLWRRFLTSQNCYFFNLCCLWKIHCSIRDFQPKNFRYVATLMIYMT